MPATQSYHTFPITVKGEMNAKNTPGAGKTHYSIALGIAAWNVVSALKNNIFTIVFQRTALSGKSVLYANVSNLVIELREAMSNLQISSFRKRFERYALVILDELGYVFFYKSSAELLFSLISSCNDRGSIIVTSNLTFDRWEEVFHAPTLTAAANVVRVLKNNIFTVVFQRTTLDRLAHKGHILDISREKGGRIRRNYGMAKQQTILDLF